MFDLWSLVFNAFWILGLAVLLATWSYAYYEAQTSGRKTSHVLGHAGYRPAVLVGLLLFIAGMALTEERWWAKALWLLLGAAAVVHHYVRGKSLKDGDDSGAKSA